MHDTSGVRAVICGEDVAQFVDSLFDHPLWQKGALEPGNGDDGIRTGAIPEDEVQRRSVQVNISDDEMMAFLFYIQEELGEVLVSLRVVRLVGEGNLF